MTAQTTRAIVRSDGSTEPAGDADCSVQETSEIRDLWTKRRMHKLADFLRNSNRAIRHKSLLLHLVLQDYDKDCEASGRPVELPTYCQKYTGLGGSLEKSILRQLEVKQYLDEHPDLLELNNEFSWPEPGEEFLNFVVTEEIGRGALARVYLCEQQQLGGRNAVVKIEIGDSAHEAGLLGKLRHPNIIEVYWADYEASTAASYICMPFRGRNTLADLIRDAFRSGIPRKAASIQAAAEFGLTRADRALLDSAAKSHRLFHLASYVDGVVRLATDLADALAYAHRQNVIHGDIKPSNVLLAPDGTPLLIDFNLSRDRQRIGGPVGGTLAYMAPEQLQTLIDNDAELHDSAEPATDIYSFGVLLYELLTGSPPHEISADDADPPVVAAHLLEKQRSGCLSADKRNPCVDR